MDAPGRVTQEEGHTAFLRLPSAVLASNFYREKVSAVPFSRRLCKSNFMYPRISRSPLVAVGGTTYWVNFKERQSSAGNSSPIKNYILLSSFLHYLIWYSFSLSCAPLLINSSAGPNITLDNWNLLKIKTKRRASDRGDESSWQGQDGRIYDMHKGSDKPKRKIKKPTM